MDATASLQDIALHLSSVSEALTELSHDVGNMAVWTLVLMVAVIVIACRMPYGSSNKEDGAPAVQRRARNMGNHLSLGKGKVFELQFDYGLAQFGSMPTARVRVLDCDDEWVLIESTNPKKPAQAVVRISAITDVKEIAE